MANETITLDNKNNKILEYIGEEFGLTIRNEKKKEGTYGNIYFANDKDKNYVIKIFKDDITNSDFINEMSCLSVLNDYNNFPKIDSIVHVDDGKYCAIIMSDCGKILKPLKIKKYGRTGLVMQFLDIYNILYREQIIHRDIKNNNICIDTKGKLSIIDFGYSLRAPFVTTEMETIILNKHTEILDEHTVYDTKNSSKIDLLSIYHTITYIFNANNNGRRYHIYPIDIYRDSEQIRNLVYLMLVNNNTEEKRNRIFNYIQKITNFYTADSFHNAFKNEGPNVPIYHEYRKIISNIPKPLYSAMKKLLNLNPNKRISFGKFYGLVKNAYPLNNNKIRKPMNISYIPIKFTNLYAEKIYLGIKFNPYIPSNIYALTMYKFFIVKDEFDKNEHQKLFGMILYIHYTSMVENIEPSAINVTFDNELYLKYISEINGDFHSESPYNHLHRMKLFRWTQNRKYLFDYFITIASVHHIFCSIDPYILCIIITTIIARINIKLPIIADRDENDVMAPDATVDPIILTKKSLNIFFENPNVYELINKFYGYYLQLNMGQDLLIINAYYTKIYPKIIEPLRFYLYRILKLLQKK